MLLRFALCLFLLLAPALSGAVETVRIVDQFLDAGIGSRVETLATYHDYTWPWQVEHMTDWRPNPAAYLKVGDPGQHYWFRVRLSNESGSFTLVMLELDSSMLNKAEVFLVDSNGKQITRFWYTGMDLGAQSKPYPAGNFVFPVFIRQDEAFDVYIKVVNDTAAYVPIRVSSLQKYVSRVSLSQIFSGVVDGLILLAAIFSLMMYWFIRERRFLFYAMFCFCTLALLIYLNGYIFLFGFIPSAVSSQKLYICISNLFFMGLIASFDDVFRQLWTVRHFSRNNRLLLFFPLFLAFTCWFIDVSYSVYASLFLMGLLTLIYSIIGMRIWGRCSNFMKIFLLSLILFLLCWFGNTLVKFGILFVRYATDSVMYLFAAIGAFSLSFSLVYRTYLEKTGRSAEASKNKLMHERFSDLMHQAVEGFFSTDLDGRILSCNKSFYALFGYRGFDELRAESGPNISALFGKESEANEILSDLVLANQSGVKREIMLKHRDGTSFSVLMSLRIAERGGSHVVEGSIIDVSENRQIRAQIDYVFNHDAVTKLHNRTFMLNRLQKVREAAEKDKDRMSGDYFLFIDIDHFKVINNSCGSLAGDAFLQMVGTTIRKLDVQDDNIARLGGDEFGVVIVNSFTDAAVRKADSIRAAIQKLRFEWNHSFYSVTASIGIISCQSLDNSTIVSLAETACGAAKVQGRNRVYLYSDLSAAVLNYRKEIGWIAQIYNAIEQHKFVLFKQRLVFPHDSDAYYYEVFVRLLGDNGNILPASTFIEAARKFGLITHIDSLVMESLMGWADAQDQEQFDAVFINLSASSSCSQHMIRKLNRMFDKSRFDLHKLCFEISENAVKQSKEAMKDMVELIRAHRCQLAIDHFEGSIGSYAILDELEPEYVKLDCDTVVKLHEDNGSSIINSMLDKLHASNRKIVVMHIKSEASYEIIRQYDFDAYQGFTVDRPLPISLN